MSPTRTFLFAGGGTGGHIYPALAIAEQLRAMDSAIRTIVLCSERPLDAQILRSQEAIYRVIPAKPPSVRPKALLGFAASWGASIRAARSAISQCRSGGGECEMVAMGGFVAAPCAQAAHVSEVPLTLVNMDAVPGKANRWIARRADRVLTTVPVVGKYADRARERWTLTSPIVRAEALPPGDAAQCRTVLGLDPSKPTLLVTGASQGARSINRLAVRLAQEHPEFKQWQIVHQTGPGDDESIRAAYQQAGVPALVRPYFDSMGACWGAADLALARAGAGSVAEAQASRTPTVFMPYPYHRDQHQRFNALPLEAAGGAIIATDHIDESLNASGEGSAGMHVLKLMGERDRLLSMRRALEKIGPADGASKIAGLLLSSWTGRSASRG
jgi:UDP-N-acetylglucosamine:LPS N-acetylglucosamine transferase